MVHVCPACGLIQTIYGATHDPVRRQTLSCDADWGNVRHGKGARFAAGQAFLDRWINWNSIDRVLDIGANRGDFVTWIAAKSDSVRIVAIEPDSSVADRYRHHPRVQCVFERFEGAEIDGSYDLIYCSHTLEHVQSARQCLESIRTLLSPKGLLFLEVPAVESISRADIVEEYFIDKHSFHFDRETLDDWLLELGFEVVERSDQADVFNLTYVLSLAGVPRHGRAAGTDRAARNLARIKQYEERLALNRDVLRSLVESRLKPLAWRQRVAYFGAGRIFDALVKYGELPGDSVHVLVDSHLSGIVPDAHGISIEAPSALKQKDPHVCIVLGRSAEEEMRRVAVRYGVRHVVKFSELFLQCAADAAGN